LDWAKTDPASIAPATRSAATHPQTPTAFLIIFSLRKIIFYRHDLAQPRITRS
jgi:hypothetical protein